MVPSTCPGESYCFVFNVLLKMPLKGKKSLRLGKKILDFYLILSFHSIAGYSLPPLGENLDTTRNDHVKAIEIVR